MTHALRLTIFSRTERSSRLPANQIKLSCWAERGLHQMKSPRSRSTLRSTYYENHDPHAGMEQIEEEVLPIDVVDVTAVGVSPAHRPRVDDFKPVAPVLEAGLIFDHYGTVDHERVLTAEVTTKLVVRRTCALAAPSFLSLCCFLSFVSGFGVL